jgi:hypothetical protein
MLIFRGLPNNPDDSFVKIDNFDSKTVLVFEHLNVWSILHKTAVTINAIDNGTHGNGGKNFTFHGQSLAWDVSVITREKKDMDSLARYLKMRLPSPYQVAVEPFHIHIEYDTGIGRNA